MPRSMPARSAALLVAPLLLGLGACGKQAGPPAMPTPEVGVVTLAAGSVTLSTELPGRTAAFMSSEVRPQISGLIKARLFTEGALVKAGQPLYQIDPSLYRATVQQAAASLANAQANAVTATAKAARYGRLTEIEAVSKQDKDDVIAAAGQTRPQVAIICPARTISHAFAIRPHDLARPPLAHPQRRLEMCDRFPLRGRRHHFFDGRSFRPALSSIVSASSRLSRAFSSSSARSRFASDTSRPPDLAFHA